MNQEWSKKLLSLDAHRSRRLLPWLVVISLASGGLYWILTVLYPLGTSLANPRASWVSLAGASLPWLAGQIGIYFCLSLLYIAAMRLLISHGNRDRAEPENSRQTFRLMLVIILGWLLFSLLLMMVAPAGESHDIFDYLFRGRMMTQYHANPLAETPQVYNRTPYYRYIAWYKNVDTYGPVWEMTSAGVAVAVRQVAQRSGWWVVGLPSCPKSPESCRLLAGYLTGYRLLAISLAGVAAGLIAMIVRKAQPRMVPVAILIWLWNPLALMASAVGGHNDLVMIVLFLSSLLLMQHRRPYWALLALILAAHVKLTALIWIPAYALWIIRKWGLRRAFIFGAASLLSGIMISYLLYFPFGGWGTLPQMLSERSMYAANSLWDVFYRFLIEGRGWLASNAFPLTHKLPNWLSLTGSLLIPLWLFRFFQKRSRPAQAIIELPESRLWVAITTMGVFYLLAGAFWFQHWYILWVLAPAALIPEGSYTRNILPWLCFGALAANYGGSFLLNITSEAVQQNFVHLLIVIIIWGPSLAAFLYLKIPHRNSQILCDEGVDSNH